MVSRVSDSYHTRHHGDCVDANADADVWNSPTALHRAQLLCVSLQLRDLLEKRERHTRDPLRMVGAGIGAATDAEVGVTNDLHLVNPVPCHDLVEAKVHGIHEVD